MRRTASPWPRRRPGLRTRPKSARAATSRPSATAEHAGARGAGARGVGRRWRARSCQSSSRATGAGQGESDVDDGEHDQEVDPCPPVDTNRAQGVLEGPGGGDQHRREDREQEQRAGACRGPAGRRPGRRRGSRPTPARRWRPGRWRPGGRRPRCGCRRDGDAGEEDRLRARASWPATPRTLPRRMPAGSRPERRRASLVAVGGLDGEGPLHGEEGREQHRQPEQAGRGPVEHGAVGVEGEAEEQQHEEGEGHHLVGGHPAAELDPQVLAGDEERRHATRSVSGSGSGAGRASDLGRPPATTSTTRLATGRRPVELVAGDQHRGAGGGGGREQARRRRRARPGRGRRGARRAARARAAGPRGRRSTCGGAGRPRAGRPGTLGQAAVEAEARPWRRRRRRRRRRRPGPRSARSRRR